MVPFTWVFANSPMPFRKGTERLLKKEPKGLPLHLKERDSCHFELRASFGGASGNEETERDMGVHGEGWVEDKYIGNENERRSARSSTCSMATRAGCYHRFVYATLRPIAGS